MDIRDAALAGVKLLRPTVHRDNRGYFLETWQAGRYQEVLGIDDCFVQHNQSFSRHGVLRGLHYQRCSGQGKLIRVVQGRIWDVVVDLRLDSPSLGKWMGLELSGVNAHDNTPADAVQLWVPPGFAHGFVVLSPDALVEYHCTAYYDPRDEFCLLWSDPEIGVSWPLKDVTVSPRDAQGRSLSQLREAGQLPKQTVQAP